MPLAYDPEFASAFAPIAAQLATVPKPAVHDVASRRTLLNSFFGAVPSSVSSIPLPNGVSHTSHTASLSNHTPVTIHRFFPTALSTSSPSPSSLPALLHLHGGGLISISVAHLAPTLASYVLASEIQIFSVEYRLAPEHPFPAALDDAHTALLWLHAEAEQFGLDTSRIGLLGESAGGGLAAALAIRTRDTGLTPGVKKQILVYPMLDYRTREAGNGIGELAFWTGEDNVTGWAAYLGRERYEGALEREGGVTGEMSPAVVGSVEGLPALYVECPQLDIYCKENLAYATRFVEAGIEVEVHVVPGLPHGFEALGKGAGSVERVQEWRIRAMRGL
ncbi:alpha/beta hydrolase fold-containing protein 3 [Elsinoe australis]|uniref:Alpha/beta hydrolase fold-containing protein 3 n=1 Tax=Elsinoe australis TaxID=40998 RepID=A0A4U7B9F2_9PEZI|nr:alpha/beta hydrolase fold-containing protein 3 [Elsinoe australis]